MTCQHRLPYLLLITLTLSSISHPLYSDERKQHVEAELVTELESIRPGIPFWVALHLTMEEGWHTYWENPGDAGLATTIEWDLPEGFSAGELQWPCPEQMGDEEEMSYGYTDEVYLLTRITPPDDIEPGTHVTLNASITWLECKQICLPGSADLSLNIIVTERQQWPEVYPKSIGLAIASIPFPANDVPMKAERTGEMIRFTLDGTEKETTPDPDNLYFFPADPGTIDHGAKQRVTVEDGIIAIELTVSPYSSDTIRQLRGILYNADSWGDPDRIIKSLAVDVHVRTK